MNCSFHGGARSGFVVLVIALSIFPSLACQPNAELEPSETHLEHAAETDTASRQKESAEEAVGEEAVGEMVPTDQHADSETSDAAAIPQSSVVENSTPSRLPTTVTTSDSESGEIRILAWNIESNGANPDVIADQLKEMPSYDIYGFSEVRPSGFPAIKAALGSGYFYLYSKSGGDDRLAFAIKKDRFEVLDHYEFTEAHGHLINPGNYRSPFVFDLKDRESGKAFLIMLNHLARGRAEMRQEQALALRKWAANIGRPVVAIGDYNFDYVFATDKGNPAMDIFLQDDTYLWLRPDPMIDSNYYDEDQDGVDDYIDSLLDFAFLAGAAKQWDAECDIVVREGDFPDNLQTSDHRPVQVIIH